MTTKLAAVSAAVLAKLGLSTAAAESQEPAPATETHVEDGTGAGDEAGAADDAGADLVSGETADETADETAVAAAMTDTATAAAAAATKAANARWATVLASDEAKDRTDLAVHLLSTSDMSADAVKATLAKAPSAAKTSFAGQMAEVVNPLVTADGTAAGTPDTRATSQSVWERATAALPGARK
jgi:hypothetical protein